MCAFLVACIKIVACSGSGEDFVTMVIDPEIFLIIRVVIDDASYFFCSTIWCGVTFKKLVTFSKEKVQCSGELWRLHMLMNT